MRIYFCALGEECELPLKVDVTSGSGDEQRPKGSGGDKVGGERNLVENVDDAGGEGGEGEERPKEKKDPEENVNGEEVNGEEEKKGREEERSDDDKEKEDGEAEKGKNKTASILHQV